MRNLKESDSYKKALQRADKYFSLAVRAYYANDQGYIQCCTCNNWKHWKKIDCGHFRKRGNMNTRFVFQNVGPQCRKCNRFHGGRDYRFGKWIDKQFGEGTADKIEMMSRQKSSLGKAELDEIAQQYYEAYKKLKKQKHL